MQKLVRIKRKISPTSLKFLYQIAAIPLSIRESFLTELLKRKNSSLQKNVRFLKIIYHHLSEDKMLEWDEHAICEILGISKNMLYYHKHYILKHLRIHYFGWKEIEKKEFEDKTKFKTELEYQFLKATKMNEIGMRREAKNLFIKLEKTFNNKNKYFQTEENKLLLFNILKNLLSYYHSTKQISKFNLYHSKSDKLGKKIIQRNKNLYPQIMANLYWYKGSKATFYGDKAISSLKNFRDINLSLKEALKARDTEHQARIFFNLSKFYDLTGQETDAKKSLLNGIELSKQIKSDELYFVFNSLINIKNSKRDRQNIEDIAYTIQNNLNKINISAFWKEKILFGLVSLTVLTSDNLDLITRIFYEYNSFKIIYSGYDSALRYLYLMKFLYTLEKMITIDLLQDRDSKKEYLVVKSIDSFYSKKFDNAIFELNLHSHKIREVFFRKELFAVMLLANFWKGKNCDLEYAKHIMKKINWLSKTRPETHSNNISMIEIAYWGINVLTDTQYLSQKEFLQKYEYQFKNQINKITESNLTSVVDSYLMLSFITEQCGYKELKLIVKEAFFVIKNNYPAEIKMKIESVRKRMVGEKMNSNIELGPAAVNY